MKNKMGESFLSFLYYPNWFYVYRISEDDFLLSRCIILWMQKPPDRTTVVLLETGH